MKKLWVIVLIYISIPSLSALAADASPPLPPMFSVGLWPTFSLPSPVDKNATRFAFIAGARISAEYILPFFPLVAANAGIEYGYQSLATGGTVYDGTSQWISLLSSSVGLALRFPLADWLTVRVIMAGGYYYGLASDAGYNGGSTFLSGGVGANFNIRPSFSLGVAASYRYYLNLLQTIETSIGASYTFGAATRFPAVPRGKIPEPSSRPQPQDTAPQEPVVGTEKGLAIHSLACRNIFPIFHAYYDDHPLGSFTLKNNETSPVVDMSVSFFIRQYMDAPKECAIIPMLQAGEERNVELFALFKNSILEVTEGTKAAAEITVKYNLAGKEQMLAKSETIRIYDRNAMTWDDNRKAAAFVTAKDPAVLFFSSNVNAALKGKTNRALDKNLQAAIALHDALRLYGLSYVSSPLTPYEVVSKDKLAVDTLKFPRQTFEYRSGDCSDLSLLYCALMESIQIETAFITIPGHIFMAFALKATPEEARAAFSHPDELIFRNEKVWVPVEVTEREGTFLSAWRKGASEWRDNLAKNQADFYPVHDAWKIYEPVGLPGSGTPPVVPDAAKILQDFQDDVSRHIDLEIYSRVAVLQAAITKSKESSKTVNALGVLYARYDLQEKAQEQFRTVLENEEYVPALVNLANLRFLKKDMKEALAFYQRAYRKAPEDPHVLLGIARTNQELENYGMVKETYDELKKVAPKLAQQFAYLELKGEESSRAAETSGAEEMVVWDEE